MKRRSLLKSLFLGCAIALPSIITIKIADKLVVNEIFIRNNDGWGIG